VIHLVDVSKVGVGTNAQDAKDRAGVRAVRNAWVVLDFMRSAALRRVKSVQENLRNPERCGASISTSPRKSVNTSLRISKR
jgi:hypothetical protein